MTGNGKYELRASYFSDNCPIQCIHIGAHVTNLFFNNFFFFQNFDVHSTDSQLACWLSCSLHGSAKLMDLPDASSPRIYPRDVNCSIIIISMFQGVLFLSSDGFLLDMSLRGHKLLLLDIECTV
jgi:hypothetical protein